MKQVLAILLLASLAFKLAAQPLWRDAPMQASPAEIRALMPQARETSAARRGIAQAPLKPRWLEGAACGPA